MSTIYLKQSTASQQRAVGPFIDDTDFKTPLTGLTIANTDVKLVINGAASVNKNAGGGTHRINGVYGITFDATDTTTVGEVEYSIVVTGALPVFGKFQVVEEAVYDAMFAAAAPGPNTVIPTNLAASQVWDFNLSGTAVGATLAGNVLADVPSTAEFDARTILAADYFDPATDTVATVTTVGSVSGAVGSVTAGVALTAASRQAMVEECFTYDATADYGTTPGSLVDEIVDNVAAVIGPAGVNLTNLGGSGNDWIPAIVSGTADSGTTLTMVDEARDEADTDYWNGCVIEFTGGNNVGQCRVITGFTVGSPATITFSPATTNAVAVSDTYRIIQGADANVTGTVSADVVSINSVSTGSVTTVQAVQGLTTADTITTYTGNTKQTADVATLITTVGTAGASLTDLGGMSTAMKAEVNAECDTALTDYDAPTDTEMVAAFTEIKGGTWAATDTLEAIRDRGDSAWITGAGGSDRLLMNDTTIALVSSNVAFTLAAGSTSDDAYNNCTIVIEGNADSTIKSMGVISNYIGATKSVTLKYNPNPAVTFAGSDKVYILAESSLKTSTANQQIDITGGAVDTITTYTGNTKQTADVAAGVALTTASRQAMVEECFTYASTVTYAASDAASLVKIIATNASGSGATAQEIWDFNLAGTGVGATNAGNVLTDADTAIDVVQVFTDASTVQTADVASGVVLTAAGVDAIWDELTTGHVTIGSFAASLGATLGHVDTMEADLKTYGDTNWSTAAGFATAQTIWDFDLTTTTVGVNRAGNRVIDIDADGTTTRALAEGATGFAAIDTVVDTINANVGTAGAGLSAIPLPSWASTTLDVATEVWGITASTYSAATGSMGKAVYDTDQTIIVVDGNAQTLANEWADGGRLDNLLDTAAAGGASITVADIWDALTADYVVSGSMGQALGAAGTAADPLLAIVPGAYAPGTAGNYIGLIGADWDDGGRLDLILDNIDTTMSDILGIGVIQIVQPLDPDTNLLTIIRDATYDGIAFPLLSWTTTKDFTTWTGMFTIRHRDTDVILAQKAVVVASPTELTVQLDAADTDFNMLLYERDFGKHWYDIQMTTGVSNQVLGPYIVKIIQDIT